MKCFKFGCLGSNTTDHPRRKALELLTVDDIKAVPRFRAKPTRGRVVCVYDGDSVTVVAYYQGELQKFSVRIRGVDAPEIRSSNPRERILAKKAKAFTESVCSQRVVRLKNFGSDKYGRVLADVWVDGKSVGSSLIAAGFARVWDGKFMKPW